MPACHLQPPTTAGDVKEMLRITCWLQLCLRAGVYEHASEGMSLCSHSIGAWLTRDVSCVHVSTSGSAHWSQIAMAMQKSGGMSWTGCVRCTCVPRISAVASNPRSVDTAMMSSSSPRKCSSPSMLTQACAYLSPGVDCNSRWFVERCAATKPARSGVHVARLREPGGLCALM